LKEKSIYTSGLGTESPTRILDLRHIDRDPDSIASIRHVLEDTSAFKTSADRIVLTIQGASPVTISSLASDISQWIAESGTGFPTSKLNLLCGPVFQGLAKDHFGDNFINGFRLLIWATMLLNSATIKPGKSAHIQAEKNLKSLVNFLGQAIILEVDRLCKHSKMKTQSSEQRLLLFLVIIGLCLSASYIPLWSGDVFRVSWLCIAKIARMMLTDCKASDEDSKKLEAHIEGLAYIGVYVGHKCHLFCDGFDAKALVAAAQKRWNHIGEYRCQIPPTLSKAITVELSREAKMDITAGPIDVTIESTVDAGKCFGHEALRMLANHRPQSTNRPTVLSAALGLPTASVTSLISPRITEPPRLWQEVGVNLLPCPHIPESLRRW
jgi:hypothetical protein